MLEMLLDKKLLFVLMGILTGLGVVDKCIVSMTMKRMVEAAGSMSKSNHPLMRLVRAKFEHACMISDTVENVGVFVDKYLYEYKSLWITTSHAAQTGEDMCGTAYRNRTCRCGTELSGIWHGRCCPADGCMWRRTWNPGMAVPSDNG
mgnify:CR=1 FL=1